MPQISETEIGVFVDAVSNYFQQSTQESAQIRGAYLALSDSSPPAFDFTGLISISGKYRGCVYFSAPREMLSRLLIELGEPQVSNENLLDAVGEIANTISGNARRHFGEEMVISVPLKMSGADNQLGQLVRERPFVIMVKWRRYEAAVIVDIESTT